VKPSNYQTLELLTYNCYNNIPFNLINNNILLKIDKRLHNRMQKDHVQIWFTVCFNVIKHRQSSPIKEVDIQETDSSTEGMELHLPCGITKSSLLHNTSNVLCAAHWYSTYLPQRDGRLSWFWYWLHTEIVYVSIDTSPIQVVNTR